MAETPTPTSDQTPDAIQSPFDRISNFRDVGRVINEFLGEKRLAEGKIFRSARPDEATQSDRQKLRDVYHIQTVMDLRTLTEHENQAKKRAEDMQSPALLESNPALAEPVQIPGITYLEINVNGKGFERSLLWQLSTWNITKLLFLIAMGYRTEAIGILGRNVMQPRGLCGLAQDSLMACGPEIAEALRAFLVPSHYAILVHCTQGKDRTGLIVLLVLLLLGVPMDAITADYVKSEAELLPEREERMKEISSIGLTEEFAGCPKDWCEKTGEFLNEKYGGVEMYCEGIGFSESEQKHLIAMLRA